MDIFPGSQDSRLGIPEISQDSIFQDSQILGNMKALLLEESPAFLEALEGADLEPALGWLS